MLTMSIRHSRITRCHLPSEDLAYTADGRIDPDAVACAPPRCIAPTPGAVRRQIPPIGCAADFRGSMSPRARKSSAPPEATQQEVPDDAMAVLQRFRILIRAAQRHSQWIDRQSGVSGAQLWMLQELHESPGLRVGELARRMALHQSTASNLVDRLESTGLVLRDRSSVDQRVVQVFLTEKGKALLSKAPSPARGILPEALRQLDARRLARLAAELDHLLSHIHILDREFGKELLPFNE